MDQLFAQYVSYVQVVFAAFPELRVLLIVSIVGVMIGAFTDLVRKR